MCRCWLTFTGKMINVYLRKEIFSSKQIIVSDWLFQEWISQQKQIYKFIDIAKYNRTISEEKLFSNLIFHVYFFKFCFYCIMDTNSVSYWILRLLPDKMYIPIYECYVECLFFIFNVIFYFSFNVFDFRTEIWINISPNLLLGWGWIPSIIQKTPKFYKHFVKIKEF